MGEYKLNCVKSFFSGLFWNVESSKTAPLIYQYVQRTPNKIVRQAKILNLSGNSIANCWAVCPQFCTGCVHFLFILVNAR